MYTSRQEVERGVMSCPAKREVGIGSDFRNLFLSSGLNEVVVPAKCPGIRWYNFQELLL